MGGFSAACRAETRRRAARAGAVGRASRAPARVLRLRPRRRAWPLHEPLFCASRSRAWPAAAVGRGARARSPSGGVVETASGGAADEGRRAGADCHVDAACASTSGSASRSGAAPAELGGAARGAAPRARPSAARMRRSGGCAGPPPRSIEWRRARRARRQSPGLRYV